MQLENLAQISAWLTQRGRSKGLQNAEVEDFVQETLARYLERGPEAQGDPRSWLRRVFDNLLTDRKRSASRVVRTKASKRKIMMAWSKDPKPITELPPTLVVHELETEQGDDAWCARKMRGMVKLVEEDTRGFPLAFRGTKGRGEFEAHVTKWTVTGLRLPKSLWSFYEVYRQCKGDRRAMCIKLQCTLHEVRRDIARIHRWIDECEGISVTFESFLATYVRNLDREISHAISVEVMRSLRPTALRKLAMCFKAEDNVADALAVLRSKYSRRAGCSHELVFEKICAMYPSEVSVTFAQ